MRLAAAGDANVATYFGKSIANIGTRWIRRWAFEASTLMQVKVVFKAGKGVDLQTP